MAAYAILKVSDALVTVLLLDLGRVVLMADVAGVGRQSVRMARPAGTRAALTVVVGKGVLAVVARRGPCLGGVAGRAITPQQTQVKGRVVVAGRAHLGRSRKDTADVTA